MAERILIVDDSVSMRQMLKMILESAGYEVEQASDGDEALEKLSDDFDAMVTDYNMPKMNGAELIGAVRKGSVNRAIPVLILTTESEKDKMEAAKQAGASGWLNKPFEQEALISAVKKIAGRVEF